MNTCTEESFLKDVKDHKLSIIKDDGLYRHLKFRKPDTGIMGFDLVTWPGTLCYTGDMGTYVFSRIPDMFAFFRFATDQLRIDRGYWAEKCLAHTNGDSVIEYSKEIFDKVIKEYLDDEAVTDILRSEVEDLVLSCHENEYEARQAVRDFTSTHQPDFEFGDFWERNLTEYTHRYTWCCYALVWGIKQYDLYKYEQLVKEDNNIMDVLC